MKLLTIGMLSFGLLCANAYAVDNQTTQPLTGNLKQMQVSEVSNKTEGEAFLAANKAKAGVVTTPSGLQYKVMIEGHGERPTEKDRVTVNYAGTLINGKEFDSSYKRGQPAVFPVGAVIPGWVEALKLMPVGSTWELYIPSGLAYAGHGAPPSIGPDETLIFKVELINIVK